MSDRSSPNHIYRTVWNDALGAMVAVAEITSGRGHGSGSGRVRTTANHHPATIGSLGVLALSIAIGWATMSPARANPTGAQAVHGQASVVGNGNALTVTTQNGPGTSHSVINWQSFSIPGGSSTTFVQPGNSSLSINRVITNTPSAIFGTLSSNGRLVLVNQSGIAIGAGAVVDTAGFTASSLRMLDADALAGRLRFGQANASMGGASGITVDGRVTARDGDVVLIAPNIAVGAGALVQAPNGSTVLAAGQQVEITGRGLDGISMTVQAPSDAALNLGQLQGDAVAIFAGTLRHSGEIQATSVQIEGGKVVLHAAGALSIDGQIQARGAGGRGGDVAITAHDVDIGASAGIHADASGDANGGKVLVLADMDSGTTRFAGRISARGGDQGGNGGFVETSGANVKVSDSARVSTLAPMGLTGTWLIDPTDFTVAASGGNMTGSALSSALAGGDVTIASTASEDSQPGNIYINTPVTWSAHQLTLDAQNDIHINANMNGNPGGDGSGRLLLMYGQAPSESNIATYHIASGVSISMPPGLNFSTKQGIEGPLRNYTVITELGSEGSLTHMDLQGIQGDLFLNYALGASINASPTAGWDSSKGFKPITDFQGRFEGLGNTISNLTVNRPLEDYAGLFARISNTSVVSNLSILNASVTGGNFGGILAGRNIGGTITNSHVGGVVNGSDYVGGLVGQSAAGSEIVKSSSSGSVTGGSYIGGLVGLNRGNITDSSAAANVVGSNQVGGLVGESDACGECNPITISGSHATGNVTGSGNHIGGLVGSNSYQSIVDNSYATGMVSSTGGGHHVGGLVGYNNSSGQISHSYATGIVSSNGSNVGGLVGTNQGGSIDDSYATGMVSSTDESANVGGLVGYNSYGSIRRSFATGTVSSSGSNVGGLVGTNYGASIDNSYATGNVSGNYAVGGLVGYNDAESYGGEGGFGATVSQSYARGVVSGAGSVGGLIGDNGSSGDVSNSHWNNVTANGIGTNDGHVGADVTGLNNAEFKMASSFVEWNIASAGGTQATWRIYEGNTAPLLRGFLTPHTITSSVSSRVYNGSTDGPFISADPKILGTAVTPDKNVGVYEFSADGLYSTQLGYDLTGGGGSLTITPFPVSLIGTRAYDGTNIASAASLRTGALVGSETLVLSGAGSVVDKNVGSTKTISALGTLALANGSNGGLASNYSLTGGTLGITPASLTLTVSAATKTYDGTTAAATSAVVSAGTLFGSDAVGGGSFVFTDKNAGIGNKTVTGSAAAVSDGNGGANYVVTFVPNTSSTITPAPLTVSTSNVTKTYDGTTAAIGVPTVSAGNLFAPDSLGGGTFAFADKNAGIGNKTVTVAGVTINDGNGGLNYNVTLANNTTSTVNRATLTLTTSDVVKAYDGTTAATGTLVVGAGQQLFGGDSLSGGTYAFTNKNAGIGNKTVTVANASVNDGNGGLNYQITLANNTTSTITPAKLTLSTNAVDKVYDGNTTAAGMAIVTSGTLVDGDSLSGGKFAFLDRNVGTNKSVAVSDVTVNDGNNGANYELSFANNTGSSISVLGLSTWIGNAGNQWSNPANWSGGAVPSLSNVLAVAIPAGGGNVVFDATAGPTILQTLDSQRPVSVAGGNLEIRTGLTANDYSQSAGTVSGAGSMAVTGNFAQTGGTVDLARVLVTQNNGTLAVANITAPEILLSAPRGVISQSGALVTSTLGTLSQYGTILTGPGNRIGTLGASNTGTGDITLVNGVPLRLANVTNAGGAVNITSTGGITTVGLISAPATPLGNVTLTANSPLTIGPAGIKAGGSIVLTATDLTSAGDMTLNGPLSAGNTVTLAAANDLVQNSAVRGANGVSVTAGGTITFGPQATTDNPPVKYTVGGAPIAAPPSSQSITPESSAAGNIIVTFLDLFQRELNKQSDRSLETNPDGSKKQRFGSSLVTEEEICR